MSDQALDIVLNALMRMDANGAHPHASQLAVGRLRATPASAPQSPAPAPPRAEAPIRAKPAPVRESAPMPRLDPVLLVPPAPIPPEAPTVAGSKAARLATLRGPVLVCTRCPHLVKSRKKVVFGVGNPEAELMFIGEAPGADEDLVGEPFVGKAGQLLTKIIEAMDFRRPDVYIANVLKCRPDTPPGASGNRKPTPEEMNVCKPYLLQQIEIIQPKVIVALGGTAVEGLLGIEKAFITQLRGTWKTFQGIPLMPTFHPSYLLRNQANTEKRKVWEDMMLVLERLGRKITPRQRAFFRST